MFGPIDAIMLKSLRQSGGATIHPETGEAPRTGFMVSLPGAEKTLPNLSATTGAAVRRYLKALKALFTGHPAIYAGAWVDKHTGKVFLDASLCVPDREAAVTLGRQFGQIAIYDVTSGSEVRL